MPASSSSSWAGASRCDVPSSSEVDPQASRLLVHPERQLGRTRRELVEHAGCGVELGQHFGGRLVGNHVLAGVTHARLGDRPATREVEASFFRVSGRSRDEMTTPNGSAGSPVEPTDERFKELVGTIDAIVTEYDRRTNRFTYISEQAERILGYPPELLEDALLSHVDEEDRKRIEAVTTQAVRERSDYAYERQVRAADGRLVWLRVSASLVLDEHGEPASDPGRLARRDRVEGGRSRARELVLPAPGDTRRDRRRDPRRQPRRAGSTRTTARSPSSGRSRSPCSTPATTPRRSAASWAASPSRTSSCAG